MRKLLVLLTGCFLVAGIIGMLLVYSGYRKGQTEYADLVSVYYKKDDRSKISVKNTEAQIVENEVQLPADAPLPATIDFSNLMQINEDIVGWIDIPAIDISYPILQGKDNEYYLHRDIYKEYLYAGSIFMDANNNDDFQNFNTILYGHNMRDGSMFAKLKDFQQKNVFSSCPYFWIYTNQGSILYRIFSVHLAENESSTYTIRFANAEEYCDWFQNMKDSSVIQANIMEQELTSVVTLSTCTGEEQLKQVVQGGMVYLLPN